MTAPGSRGLEASESSLSQVTHELRVSVTWEGEVADPLASLCPPGWLQGSGQIVFFTVRLCTSTILELTSKKDVLFIIGGLECKSRKSRNTWSNRQIWPWSTEWIRAKANRVLPRERTGHSKHPLPTTQEKTLQMDITRWSTTKSDWLYSLQPKMEKLYTVSKNKTGSWLWLRSWTPYCQVSDLNRRKWGKPLDHSGMT